MPKHHSTLGGPGVRVKVKPLRVRRSACFRVLMRNMRTDDRQRHGKWEPISTSGFLVVCPSKLEACELVWMVGGAHFPRPVEMTEEQYLDWLLHHHFVVEPYTAGSAPLEVMFSEFVRGWYPNAEDVLYPQGTITSERRAEPNYRPRDAHLMMDAALRHRWEGR